MTHHIRHRSHRSHPARNRMAGALLAALLLAACGAPAEVPVLTPAQLKPEAIDGPFWVSFEAGEQLPVHVDVSSALFVLKPEQPLKVTVTRSFYLLIGDGPPRLSLDRKTFLDGGGSFRFGVGNSKSRGPHIDIGVHLQGGEPEPTTAGLLELPSR